MNYRLKILLLLLICALFQSGCSSQAAYTGESFSSDSPFKMKVDGDVAAACESARRSLLGQGYLIDLASSEEVKGRKAARGEGQQNTFIEMNVVCVPERKGSTIFATGVFSTYALKTNSSSASVGLSALGSISLPIGQSADSLVKVSEETIDDKDFYKRFFAAVDTVLGEMAAGNPDEESAEPAAEEPPAPESIPPKAQTAIWPELFPEQDKSEVAPDTSSGQIEREIAPDPFPAEPAPAADHVTYPEPVAPVGPSGATLHEEPLGISPEPAPGGAPLGVPPAPVPDDEPLGIPPAPSPVAEPPVAPPAPSPVAEPPVTAPALTPVEEPPAIVPEPQSAPEQAPVAGESELAPIRVTAAKRVAPEPAAAVQKTPEAGSEGKPASSIDNIF